MTWRALLSTMPPAGSVVDLGGQTFTFLRTEPYRRIDGRETSLLVWTSHCAECGKQFWTRTSANSLGPSRRCRTHRRGGKPVASRSRKIPVTVLAPEPTS